MELWEQGMRLKEELSEIRRKIHMKPEKGFEEFETTQLIKQALESYGVTILDLDMPTGVVGILCGEKPGKGKTIAFRADMDALPIVERTGLPYISQEEGKMHACGHDGHTAMLLGLAKLLSERRKAFSGAVKFLFQPAEEIAQGAKAMIAAGALENPKVEEIIALHAWPDYPTGVIGFWEGHYYAAADAFQVKLIGDSGHGAYPHKSKESLLAAAHGVVALQSITSRQLNAIDNTVLSVCMFHSGTAANVMPENSEFGGTIRTHNPEIREKMPEKIETIIQGVANAFQCDYEFKHHKGIPGVFNHPQMVRDFIDGVEKLLGKEAVKELPGPVMGSEDFGEYSALVEKSAIFRIGITDKGKPVAPLHSQRFDFNDEAIPYGVVAMAQYVLREDSQESGQ